MIFNVSVGCNLFSVGDIVTWSHVESILTPRYRQHFSYYYNRVIYIHHVFKNDLSSSLTGVNKFPLHYYLIFLKPSYAMPYILLKEPSQAISNSNLHLQILYL
jgi:hypothetical protein